MDKVSFTKPSPDKFYFTVESLMEVLKTFPPDLPVITSGYESGFENMFHPQIVTVKHEPDNPYFEGEFQSVDDTEKDAFEAVIIQRVMRND